MIIKCRYKAVLDVQIKKEKFTIGFFVRMCFAHIVIACEIIICYHVRRLFVFVIEGDRSYMESPVGSQ